MKKIAADKVEIGALESLWKKSKRDEARSFALGLLGRGAAGFEYLKEALLGDRSLQIQFQAVTELRARKGKDALLALRQALGKERGVEVRRAVTVALSDFGAEAVEPLKKCLSDGDRQVRLDACIALGKLGPEAKAAIGDLSKCLADGDRQVRLEACIALGKLGPEAKAAIPDLISALQKLPPPVALHIPWTSKENFKEIHASLSKIGKEAVPDLKIALKNLNPVVRWAAAEALGQIGADARPALQELRHRATPQYEAFIQVRQAADRAIERINASLSAPGMSPPGFPGGGFPPRR